MPGSILAAIIIFVFCFCAIDCFFSMGREDTIDKCLDKYLKRIEGIDSFESVCSAKLHVGKTIHFRPYFNPGITSQKDKKIADCCSNYLALQDAPLFDHMSIINGEIWLYRDEIMNDDVISRIQDALASTDLKIRIVYDWK